MTKYPKRVLRGVPEGGRFSVDHRAEPDLTLGTAPGARLVLPEDGFLGRQARCPEPRPADWVFGRDECIDAAVGTVIDGPLSRGSFHAWHEWAMTRSLETNDPAYDEFAMGLRTGVASLYERRLGAYEPGLDRFKPGGTPTYIASSALDISGTKRASAEDREHWRKLLKRTPSEAWHRGHLAAGLILSGADGYWGLREEPDAAVLGPVTDEPDDPRDDSNQVFDFEVMGEDGLATWSVDNLGGGSYAMYADDGTRIDFEYHGDPEDHSNVQDRAAAALKARGIIDDDTWIS